MHRVLAAPTIMVVHKDCNLTTEAITKLAERNISFLNFNYWFKEFGIGLATHWEDLENITKKLSLEVLEEYTNIFKL